MARLLGFVLNKNLALVCYPSFVILVGELILNGLKPLLEDYSINFHEEQLQLESFIEYTL